MSILDETRFIERLQFFNGQRLFASDLQGIEAFNREMCWLHNRSLHQPGIGNGFAVLGKKGDREVTIGPGYAIDAMGREIVLTQNQVQPIPPVASEVDGKSVFYDLTVSYPDDSDLEETETREGICLPRGVVRLREEPVFCWARLERDGQGNLHAKSRKLKEEIKNGLKIVLARLEVFNCQLQNDVSIAQRRSARPATQPYIACGTAKPTWSDWVVDGETVGLIAPIDTTEAGFLTTPCYSVRIDGLRVTTSTASEAGPTATETMPPLPVIVADFTHIEDPNPGSFTVYVFALPIFVGEGLSTVTQPSGMRAAELARAAAAASPLSEVIEWAKSHWSVVWMGVEG